jgi:2,3-bisphosphoglycerate-independent phosphoglycerate mutase
MIGDFVKHLVLIGDGMADYPLDALDGRTPIEAAATPAMDRLVAQGTIGQYCPIPEGMPPGSDIGNLSLFGYDPRATFSGRAPMEAANQGLALAADEVAFRCNLVTLADGRMHDFTSGHITTDESRTLIAALNEALAAEFPVAFNTGVSYRHLAVVRAGAAASDNALAAAQCTPPHDITGQDYAGYLPEGEASTLIRAMMDRSRAVLAGHPVNVDRIARGLNPATSIWLWGQGRAPKMARYAELYGKTGAVVSAVDLVKGIGVCAGLQVLDVPGATGWLDTNYAGKVSAALGALETLDVAFIHVEAPDETAHQGRIDLKMQAIDDFDRHVVAPCLAWAERRGDTRVLVAPDHFTLISTKTHAGGPVPFALYGPGVPASGQTAYSEGVAATSGILIRDGHRLVRAFLGDAAPAL